jgi:hypothetical protein
MPEPIKYAGSATVPGGPAVAFTEPLAVTSYTKISAEVPKEGKVALDTKGNNIVLLLMKASNYKTLAYTVDDEAATKQTLLGVPLMIAGAGALGRFSKKGLETLTFFNDLKDPVTVEVFIGRT